MMDILQPAFLVQLLFPVNSFWSSNSIRKNPTSFIFADPSVGKSNSDKTYLLLSSFIMAEIVEGDWKDFTFKMASEADYPGILAHLRQSFYIDEPINKYLGQGELKNKDMDTVAVIYMQEGISFFATHTPSGKIAGVRVMGIANKGEDHLEELVAILESQEAKDLMPTILELREEANFFERLGVDKYGDFLFVSVDKEFRGQGLATEIYNRAISLLKSKGVTAAESIFTNPISQSIARKLGFVELSRRKLKDYKTTDGRQVLPGAGDDEVAIAMAKTF